MAPMLSSLTIEHFRTFRERVTIPLKPITVFIGPNNSGKTNAIRALQLMAKDAPRPREPDERTQIELRGELDGRPGTLFLHNGGEVAFEVPPLAQFLKRMRVASLSAPVLREPATVVREPQLGERGENFGAVLDWISGRHPAMFRAINEELRATLGVDGCTTLVTDDGKKIAAIIEGDQSFPADVISDGVLLYLGLTTVAHLVGKQSLLIIEEPENGIHPRRLKALLEQIRRIATAGTQVILTTHSPLILDEFSDEPESVVVFERDEKGTHVKQLAEKEMRDVLSGDFGLGDLWYSGAIGGVPT